MIAIIGILAAIVMINVTKYIQSAKDVAIEEEMTTAQTIVTGYYAGNGDLSGLCPSGYDQSYNLPATSPLHDILLKINRSIMGDVDFTALNCFTPEDSNAMDPPCKQDEWSIEVDLHAPKDGMSESGVYWCVDSTGFRGKSNGSVRDSGTCHCIFAP